MDKVVYLVSRIPVVGRGDREFSIDDGRRFKWTTDSAAATDYGRVSAFRTVRLLNSEKAKGGSYDYGVWAIVPGKMN